MMIRPIAAVAFVALSASIALAQQPLLREALSDNKRLTLRIEPGAGKDARAQATLLRGGTPLWNAPLVNAVAPAQAFIRNDAEFVVTLDDHARGGAQNAVVVYDRNGRAQAALGLRELLRPGDWKHVRVREREVDWLSGARMRFRGERRSAGEFVIRLRWGREIRIDLAKLHASQSRDADNPDADLVEDAVPGEIAALLERVDSLDESDWAQEDALEELEQETLHALLVRLLGLSDSWNDSEDSAEVSAMADEDADAFPLVEAEYGPAYAEGVHVDWSAPLVVPLPDPLAPVDYVTFLNEQIAIDGPDATPLFEAAMALYVKPPDRDLVRQAMQGDSQAMGDPGFQDWLQSNQAALEMLREATRFDYRGWALVPENESGLLISALLPGLAPIRNLSSGLLVEGRERMAQGDFDGAMNDYLLAMRVGDMTGAGVTLIENLVGVQIRNNAADALLDSFADLGDENVDYERIAARIEDSYDALRPMSDVIKLESASLYDIIQSSFVPDPESGRMVLNTAVLEKNGLSDGLTESPEEALGISYEASVLGAAYVYGTMADAVAKDYRSARAFYQRLDQTFADPGFREVNPLLAAFVPSYGYAYRTRVLSTAQQRAAALVARLKAYRQRHGVYPESLEPLGGGRTILDPFTDEPFRYKSSGSDFRLYSVGPDLEDDNGVEIDNNDGDKLYWPRPARP